jgi:hypothetical protein
MGGWVFAAKRNSNACNGWPTMAALCCELQERMLCSMV